MWVEIQHPDLPDALPAVVTAQAFELVWSKGGWQLASEPPNLVVEPSEEEPDSDG